MYYMCDLTSLFMRIQHQQRECRAWGLGLGLGLDNNSETFFVYLYYVQCYS